MTRRDQELLDKQLWGVSSRSPQNGMTTLTIVAVFLAGMGIGDIVSKTKQANTHYVALISYPNGQEKQEQRHDPDCHHLRHCVVSPVRRMGG